MALLRSLPARAALLVTIGVLAALLSSVPSLRWVSLLVTIGALLTLGWLVVRRGHTAAARSADLNSSQDRGSRERGEPVQLQFRAGEARWRAIIQSAVDGIVLIDGRGRIEAFNPGAERLFGYSEGEVLGQNVNVLMPSPYREEHDAYLRRYLETGTAKIIGIGREVIARRRDGSTFPVHLAVGELTVDGERKFTGILHDLTGRVRLEEQLRERTALARVGEMAAVIAHEVKNPLAGIRGVMQVLAGRQSTDARDVSVLHEIVKRIDALDVLINDLLLFARPPRLRRSMVDVVPLIRMTADLICQDPALRGIEVRIHGSSALVSADPEMLKIVFQNLLLNGAHAMHGQGQIQVTVTADDVCQVTIADAGPGIPLDIRDKVFTAFFTTKSRGSGLGLATTKRLVEAHDGEIRVDCPPAGGTTITVRLPLDAVVGNFADRAENSTSPASRPSESGAI
jgi:two-component system, LuxR family, sensor kinase FixL